MIVADASGVIYISFGVTKVMTRPIEIHLLRLPSLFAHNLHISNAEGEKRPRQIYFF